MKSFRTVKIKINGSIKADGFLAVWLKAANWLSGIVFKTKELNSNKLAKAHYANLRELGLPSQLACSLCKVVTATYKTAASNKRWKLAKFSRAVLPVVWKRDFARNKKGVTLWGEVLMLTHFKGIPESGWKDSRIKKIGNQWWLFLCHEMEVLAPKTEGCLVGADLGLKRMIVATNSANTKTFFHKGGELNHRRTCIRRTRSAVQSVGTRSSRRLLKRLNRNEASVTAHVLHVASKALVSYAVSVNARTIVMEDLTNIRDSSLTKGKSFREKIHRWPYADFKFKVGYKAQAVDISLESVSPKNTSRGCNACGHVEASNRKGLLFCCKKCGHKDDADRNASKNIRARSVSILLNSMETGSGKPPQSSERSEIALESVRSTFTAKAPRL